MDDIHLYCQRAGQGHPLVLLHGNGEDHTYFAPLIPRFAAFRRVYALDTRGHGQSPRGNAPFTLVQFARDLLAFLDREGIEQADLLGFSDGGNIALLFALEHPERVSRLVLNGANLDPGGVKPSTQIPIVLGYRIASLFPGQKARRNAELLGLMVREPHIPPGELERLTMPALVIAGTRDMIRPEHTRLIAEHIPGARLQLLEGSHFIAKESPDAFYRAVADFLAQPPGERRPEARRDSL